MLSRAQETSRRAMLVSVQPTPAMLRARRLPGSLASLLGVPDRPASMECHVCVPASARDERLTCGSVPPDAVVHRLHSGASPLDEAARLVADGVERLFFVGCDCPDLSPNDLAAADRLLETTSLVVGSNLRGRIYLLALRASRLPLLQGIVLDADGVAGELIGRAGETELETLPARIVLASPADVRELVCSSRHWRRRIRTLMNSPHRGTTCPTARAPSAFTAGPADPR